jgi:hypothetical protein
LDDASIVYTLYSMMNVKIKRGTRVIVMLLIIQLVSWQIERSGVYCLCIALGRIEAPSADYLIENKIWRDPTHILFSEKPSVSVLVFSPTCEQTRQNQNYCILHRNLLPPPPQVICAPYSELAPSTSNLKGRGSKLLWNMVL